MGSFCSEVVYLCMTAQSNGLCRLAFFAFFFYEKKIKFLISPLRENKELG
jgi:hypothetical protein